MFKPVNEAWGEYNKKSIDIAQRGDVRYVVKTDIVDFYNQISVHRIQNAIESAGINRKIVKVIHDFLIKINGKNSRGIPIGPSFSHLLAECYLTSLDNALMNNGIRFTRYVDDYRVFCKTYFR